LVNSQYIKPGYIDSMLGREKVANTYRWNVTWAFPKADPLLFRRQN
jgi:mannitol/fructose-specific phosphotransferase system IIA component